MEEQSTTRLGTTVHAYAVTASLSSPTAFRCYAPYASLFADGPLPVAPAGPRDCDRELLRSSDIRY
ncbi:hypothetical protein ACVWWJ_001871 [Luteibacter sp. HA06]